MIELLVIIPLVSGFLIFLLPRFLGKYVVIATGFWNLGFALFVWMVRPAAYFDDYFRLSSEGLLTLLVTSFLFLMISFYCISYHRLSPISHVKIFCASMLLFLAAMSMACISDHIIVLWVAIEATTLASAPLILSHRSKEALEAVWKYVLICSVGIALALLGSLLLTVAMDIGGVTGTPSFSNLSLHAARLDQAWLKAGFVFILVGYGTKMGLAPMHTWLPDAHSEAPSPVSALLSGALLNCAFLGILKTYTVLWANGLSGFAGTLLIVFGLLSVVVATAFILKQADYKRMLAYSSIENMGIIAFGTGIGGLAAFGAMLHLIHHSLIKSSLFLTSGNILLGYGTKVIDGTSGLAKSLPATFSVYFAGFLGLTGFPPFGIFLSELLILFGAFQKGYYFCMALLLFLLIAIGAGLANYFMRISFGSTTKTLRFRETLTMVLPQFLLLLTSAVLFFWIPEAFMQTILESIGSIGGGING